MRKEHYKKAHTWPSLPSIVFRPLALSFRQPLPSSRVRLRAHVTTPSSVFNVSIYPAKSWQSQEATQLSHRTGTYA